MVRLLKSFPKTLAWLAGAIFLLVIAAYSNHFHNDFHFDDSHTISNNMFIRDISNIPLFFVDARTTSSFPPNQAYRPGLTALNTIDYWVMHQFFPKEIMPRPFVFHFSIFVSYLLLGFLLYVFIYWLIPATKVSFRNALIAGFIGGTLFEIAKVIFVFYISRVALYDLLYGSLSVMPIFLIWVYICSLILFLCAQIVYVLENKE